MYKSMINRLNEICKNCHKRYGEHFGELCPTKEERPNKSGKQFKREKTRQQEVK